MIQIQILDEAVLFHIVLILLEKVCIDLFSQPAMARSDSLTLVCQPVKEKEKLTWFCILLVAGASVNRFMVL